MGGSTCGRTSPDDLSVFEDLSVDGTGGEHDGVAEGPGSVAGCNIQVFGAPCLGDMETEVCW
jgi:hypothetical protein